MTAFGDSLALDARALELLGELLDADVDTRAVRLEALRAEDAGLHGRVQRLLDAGGADTAALRASDGLGAWTAAAGPVAQPGRSIAGYRLIRGLGRGGMAEVWLAERADGGLRREVAVKLPIAAASAGVLAERFARERDVLAALDHPHIARLYDAGVDHGCPYIVLEHVVGQPLPDHADAHRLDLRQRVELFRQVLSAVDHAHRRMVVHRDLKPGNILVDEQGRVKLLDFGIAKLLEPPAGAAELTQEAGALYTPRYAAPEQLQGLPVSAASDVYAAGVVLYELLTGRWPYAPASETGGAGVAAQPSLAQALRAAALGAVAAPGLSTDLDTVLLKALARDPAQRYPTIERFDDDLRRWLGHQPILARRVPAWRRGVLLWRRHARAAAAGAVAIGLLLASGALAWMQWRESTAQRDRADIVRQFVYTMVADAEPAEGRSDVTGAEMVDAAVQRARRDVADPRLRGELLGALGRVYSRLQQPAAARAVLNEALGLIEPRARPSDPALNLVRAELARAVNLSDNARALALAGLALQSCTTAEPDCAKARATAHYLLAANDAWRGRARDALRHSRASAQEAEAGYGAASLELATSLEILATAARNQGQLAEAAGAIERAMRIAAGRVMRAASRDRLELVRALVDADLGDAGAARERVQRLLQHDAAPYERAAQWRVLSTVETELGHADAAMAAAASAADVLPPELGASSPQAWLARQAWGHAASRAGRHGPAVAALAQAREGLVANGMRQDDVLVLKVRRQWAEALLRAGEAGAARDELSALQQAYARLEDPHPVEAALTGVAWGCALARSGDRAGAAVAFDTAAARWATAVPAGHPALRRHRALRDSADCASLV